MNSCFPTRAAVGLRNSSRVVVRGQAGWVVALFTVGGDSLGLTALCVILRPHGKQFRWRVGTLSQTIILQPCPHLSVGCQVLTPCLMSDRTLIRSRHHPSQSPPSIIDADPFFSLPHFRSPSVCQIPALPKSPARSLLAPRCFPLLPPLKFEGESE